MQDAQDPASGPSRSYSRGYRACEECRARKAKCIFPATGQPFKPPCERCIRSGRPCVVATESKRGKWKRNKTKSETVDEEISSSSISVPHQSTSANALEPLPLLNPSPRQAGPAWPSSSHSLPGAPLPDSHNPSNWSVLSSIPNQSIIQQDGNQNLPWQTSTRPSTSSGSMSMNNFSSSSSRPWESFQSQQQQQQPQQHQQQLQQQLQQSQQASSQIDQTPKRRAASAEELKNPADAFDILIHAAGQSEAPSRAPSPSNLDEKSQEHQLLLQPDKLYPSLDECELVKDGILIASKVRELSNTFVRFYHPFYPLIATIRLTDANLGRFAYEDPILLAAICVIASRGMDDSALHLKIWSYTKNLLTNAMWGERASVGAVEALLLLSEWVGPEMQSQGRQKVKDTSLVWVMVGSAIRLGYLLGLDQATWAKSHHKDPLHPNSRERRTLAWTCCYWADRSISVRMGRGFWSRGPANSAQGKKAEYPTLFAACQLDHVEYASAMQAHLDLIQLMSNIQDVLYSSTKEKQMEMMRLANYARYIDDFRLGVDAWKRTWWQHPWSSPVKETLHFSWLYLRLYLNSYPFSAILARTEPPQDENSPAPVFQDGIGKLPDARYIMDAVDAALAIITEWQISSPQGLLIFMPPRYYSYLVFAAVFLLKTVRLGALKDEQAQEVGRLVENLVTTWRSKDCTWPHPAGQYANLLDVYMLRMKLKKQQHLSTGYSPDSEGVLDSIRQFFATHNADMPSVSPNSQNGVNNPFAGYLAKSPSTGISPSNLPLADWASNVENGMDGLPSLSAFFTDIDWSSQTGFTNPISGDSGFSSLNFM